MHKLYASESEVNSFNMLLNNMDFLNCLYINYK